jgi:type IX secretion system PorP/SprF family membrane protein
MKKLFTKVAIAVAGFTGVAIAQQDPQFTQFMHNKLIYNAGYAGTSGGMCGVLQFRQQWAGYTGSPQSIALAADMPLTGLPIGIGLQVMSDKIGPMNTVFLRGVGAYNHKIGKGTLGIGIDIGMLQKKISADWVPPETGKIDPKIPGMYGDALQNPDFGKATYDLGAGIFYQIPNDFYIGASCTHVPGQVITSKDGPQEYDLKQHIYVMAGKTFQINKWNKITPNVLYKTDAAAMATDLNLTYMWSDMIWIGGTYRLGDAAAALLGFQMPFGGGYMARIGYSYDFAMSQQMRTNSKGSHEIILGLCFVPKIKKLMSYGTDRYLDN